MIAFTPTPRKEMEERWGVSSRRSSTVGNRVPHSEKAPPRPRNVRAILDLGTITYFSFRGRSYGVPPLPWQQGEALLDAWLEIRGYGEEVSRENLRGYYQAFDRLSRHLWKNCRPSSRLLRVLKVVGLCRNPFRKANEAELVDLAVFFLGLRMKSIGIRPTVHPKPRT